MSILEIIAQSETTAYAAAAARVRRATPKRTVLGMLPAGSRRISLGDLERRGIFV